MDHFFRQAGVDLATEACEKALKDWGGSVFDITHTVSVTCTNSGLPGYDRFVATRLGGAGCAGGLAIMRVAADIACGWTARRKIARVLAFACELCSPNLRHELTEAENCDDPHHLSVAATLFSDGAAAFIISNDGLSDRRRAIFECHEWGSCTIPDTKHFMSFNPYPMGYKTILHRHIPDLCVQGMNHLFEKLLPSVKEALQAPNLDASDFDWAVHAGGKAIINKTEAALELTCDQIEATRQIYRTRGNSSSATVLAVLDLLRQTDSHRQKVAALAFGPGLTIEMAFLTRCK
jgi:fungal type III polyketide synthase